MNFNVDISSDDQYSLEGFADKMRVLSEEFPDAHLQYVEYYDGMGANGPNLAITIKYED